MSGRDYAGDVLKITLKNLGIHDRRAFERGMKRSRQAPDPNGLLRDTAFFDGFEYDIVETSVKRLFDRLKKCDERVGLAKIILLQFVPSRL